MQIASHMQSVDDKIIILIHLSLTCFYLQTWTITNNNNRVNRPNSCKITASKYPIHLSFTPVGMPSAPFRPVGQMSITWYICRPGRFLSASDGVN